MKLKLLTALLALSLSATAFAESIWINSEVVEIRSGKGPIYPVVAKVKKGQELSVILREGKWLKVAVPPNTAVTAPGAAPAAQGYVYENAVSATKVNGNANLLSGLTGGDMSTAAAAKGLQPSAEHYASGKGMSSAPLNNLIAMRNKIHPKEWERFMAEGHVGPK